MPTKACLPIALTELLRWDVLTAAGMFANSTSMLTRDLLVVRLSRGNVAADIIDNYCTRFHTER